MTRAEFLDWLEGQLRGNDVPARRWQVEPGLEDLEVQLPSGEAVRLRIVRTASSAARRVG